MIILRYQLDAGDRLFQTEDEVDFVDFAAECAERGRWTGERRNAKSKARDAAPHLEQNEDAIRSNHRGGGMAEVAFARKINIYPNLDFDHYLAYNLRLPGGDRIQVQWNEKAECILDVKREANHVRKGRDLPDFHVVLTGEAAKVPQFVFAGWATHAEVLASPIEPRKHGPAHVCAPLRSRLEIFTCARGEGYR